MATQSLADYLAKAKADALTHLAGKGQADGHLLLVMGNSAGDLDSAASAIGLSYLLTQFPEVRSRLGLPASLNIAPLVQTAPEDLVLRPENKIALLVAGLQSTSPLHVTDLKDAAGRSLDHSSSVFGPSNRVHIGLVDHAALGAEWRSSTGSEADRDVVAVVDHHVDEGAHADAKLRILQGPGAPGVNVPTGSCASIVAGLFHDHLSAGEVPREVADLLLSAVIIDTDNVRPAPEGKASQVDEEAMKTLLPVSSFADQSRQTQLLSVAKSNVPAEVQALSHDQLPVPSAQAKSNSTKEYWSLLVASKGAVDHLSDRDLLRRDYKESLVSEGAFANAAALRFGFSSVPIGLSRWIGRVNEESASEAVRTTAWNKWWDALDAWRNERQLDGVVIGTSFREANRDGDVKHRREAVVAFASRRLTAAQTDSFWLTLIRELESSSELDLRKWKGAPLPDGGREHTLGLDDAGRRGDLRAIVRRQDPHASRKVVLPTVVRAAKLALSRL
ncbi:hypothetical protein IE81DRAFT_348350 [Ceraceosorus guamensis]|uniref:DHH phosphoesterase n=1 Tax=Ceraceosorus guamensis TaxID=1522189 RepID=A0A316VYE3_9BASI|nr:hypothetical protein IE81DRAFT_348350 [Ceraceosorus guamensis]PWN41413.1 hypothetical protein IE81DRAFT_348350 [Ceraceosorus guamensis]